MENFINQKFLNLSRPIVFTMIFILMAFGGFAIGQTKSKKKDYNCKDKKKHLSEFKSRSKNKITRPRKISKAKSETKSTPNSVRFNFSNFNRKSSFTEKSIWVHSKAYISLCVLRGKVKVNGWKRNEARVFLQGSRRSKIGFKVREKSSKDGKPVWIQVLGYNPKKEVGTNFNTCLSGDIELDVPTNASIRILNTKGESETSIDSVREARVEVLGGDIYFNNIAKRINALTFKGGVIVRNSTGKMSLQTTTGNIIAHNTKSGDIGDYFKAKTRSGAITLQSVDQKEIESSSISGSINYIGNIRAYGRYGFTTTNGSINLAIPANSSCRLIAAYGGSFRSELPIKNITKDRTSSLVYLKGIMGRGEANLNLKSFYGMIRIQERKRSVLANF